jgi:hypothetical protein
MPRCRDVDIISPYGNGPGPATIFRCVDLAFLSFLIHFFSHTLSLPLVSQSFRQSVLAGPYDISVGACPSANRAQAAGAGCLLLELIPAAIFIDPRRRLSATRPTSRRRLKGALIQVISLLEISYIYI